MFKQVPDLGDVMIQKRSFSVVDLRGPAFATPLSILLRLSITDIDLDSSESTKIKYC